MAKARGFHPVNVVTFLPENTLANFVEPDLRITGSFSSDVFTLRSAHNEIASAVNLREIAQYPLSLELMTGAQYFDSGDTKRVRYSFRTVLQMPDASQGQTVQQAHGISNQTTLTRMYGTAKTNSRWLPIPYASSTSEENIALYMDSNNVYVVNGAAQDDLTDIVVVVEYLKQSNTG